MNQAILQKLFVEQLRDIYDAEKQLLKAIPELAEAAVSENLARALRTHLDETQNQVSRLEDVFRIAGATATGKPCKGMRGLIEEGNETIRGEAAGGLRDLAIIAGAQKVEHYEMSAYGTARTLAKRLEMSDAVRLLQETEDEEKEADAKLTEVAAMLYDSLDQEPAISRAGSSGAANRRGLL